MGEANSALEKHAAFQLERAAVLLRHAPVLYVAVAANVIFMAASMVGHAPALLTQGAIALAITLTPWRLMVYHKLLKRLKTTEDAQRVIRKLKVMGAVLTLSVCLWTLALSQHADASQAVTLLVALAAIATIGVFCSIFERSIAIFVVVMACSTCLLIASPHGGISALVVAAAGATVMCALLVCRTYVGLFRDSQSARLRIAREHEAVVKLSEANRDLALKDALTGLPNRRRFFELLNQRLAEDSQEPLVVGLVDLDGFKPVNDVYGHLAGDLVLREVGARLSGMVGKRGCLARLGGDEFAFILNRQIPHDELIAFGERMKKLVAIPYELLDGQRAVLSASIGICATIAPGSTASSCMERADFAMFEAKRSHGDSVVMFDERHASVLLRRAAIDKALRAAQFDRDFELAFQPIVETSTGEATTFEALARWTHPELGVISPTEFLPIAEKMAFTGKLTLGLFRIALRHLSQWPEACRLSFNLSARDIVNREMTTQLARLLEHSGLAANRIDFEITETALLGDFDEAQANISRLRNLGARVALDDFGTGFSSLRHIHELSFDEIKIDRSFVARMATCVRSRQIVASILSMCHTIGIDCVAEGIETEEQRLMLIELGCQKMQGYLLSRPIAAADLAPWMPAHRTELTGAA